MFFKLVCVVFRSCKGKTRGDDTLNSAQGQLVSVCARTDNIRRVVCQIEEKSDPFHTAVFFEIAGEESTRLHVDTHGSEDDGEVLLMTIMNILCRLVHQTSLSTNLSSNLVVW